MRFGSSLGIIAMVLALTTIGARAEKVDWSDFLEKPSDRKPLPRQQTPVVATTAKPTKAAKTTKPARVARSKNAAKAPKARVPRRK